MLYHRGGFHFPQPNPKARPRTDASRCPEARPESTGFARDVDRASSGSGGIFWSRILERSGHSKVPSGLTAHDFPNIAPSSGGILPQRDGALAPILGLRARSFAKPAALLPGPFGVVLGTPLPPRPQYGGFVFGSPSKLGPSQKDTLVSGFLTCRASAECSGFSFVRALTCVNNSVEFSSKARQGLVDTFSGAFVSTRPSNSYAQEPDQSCGWRNSYTHERSDCGKVNFILCHLCHAHGAPCGF